MRVTQEYIVSVHRMVTVMENRPVDPGSIQGSHPTYILIRMKQNTPRANDILCKTEY